MIGKITFEEDTPNQHGRFVYRMGRQFPPMHSGSHSSNPRIEADALPTRPPNVIIPYEPWVGLERRQRASGANALPMRLPAMGLRFFFIWVEADVGYNLQKSHKAAQFGFVQDMVLCLLVAYASAVSAFACVLYSIKICWRQAGRSPSHIQASVWYLKMYW